MKVLAPAKVNLYLDIVGKRKDGYHEIETIFQTISLYDTVEFSLRKGTLPPKSLPISLQVESNGNRSGSGAHCPADQTNILWKAAERAFQKLRLTGSCNITLKKRIPVQAGLGGGSSDAAALLKLALKYAPPKKNSDLKEIAGNLGADVPFFLEGGCAMAKGIGDRIVPIAPSPKFWAVVVKPDIGLSTQEVYRWYDQETDKRKRGIVSGKPLTYPPQINRIKRLIAGKRPSQEWSKILYNCFETVVYSKIPKLHKIKEALVRLGSHAALLSGSGSAIFSIVGSRSQGEKIKRKLEDPKLRAWVVRSV